MLTLGGRELGREAFILVAAETQGRLPSSAVSGLKPADYQGHSV